MFQIMYIIYSQIPNESFLQKLVRASTHGQKSRVIETMIIPESTIGELSYFTITQIIVNDPEYQMICGIKFKIQNYK